MAFLALKARRFMTAIWDSRTVLDSSFKKYFARTQELSKIKSK